MNNVRVEKVKDLVEELLKMDQEKYICKRIDWEDYYQVYVKEDKDKVTIG